jgi:SAM-dependent methyltransferase
MATLLRTLGRSDLGGWRILDVGCGDGRLLRQFLDLGALPEDLSGVEIRDQAVEVSRRLSPHINVVLGTGVDLPFPDSTFDLVTQFVVFSSMPEPRLREQIAREIIRVLKPGGYIFWWDCRTTMIGRLRQPVDPRDLFPGLPVNGFFTAMRPPPSTCLRMPRVLRPLGRIADCLAFPRTHYAALIGPKPQDPPQ